MTLTINMELGAAPDAVGLIRRVVADTAQRCGFEQTLTDDLKTAAGEAAAHAVLHCCGSSSGALTFAMEVRDEALEMVVAGSDGGISVEPIAADRGRGLSLMVISALADRAEFSSTPEGGTRVRMSFRVRRLDDRRRGGGVVGRVAGDAASPPRHRQSRPDSHSGSFAQARSKTSHRHGLNRRTVDQARGYINRMRHGGRG